MFMIGNMYNNKWSSEGRLLEAFGVGTAAVVSEVGVIGLEDHPDLRSQSTMVDWGPSGGRCTTA